MIKAFLLSFLILTAAQCAAAQTPAAASTEKQAAIAELIGLLNPDNKLEELAKAMSAQVQTMQGVVVEEMLDQRTDLTAAERRTLEAELVNNRKYSLKHFQDKLMSRVDYNGIINEIGGALYDKYYTLEEVRDLIAFYKTATGQKSIKVMTPIALESQRLTLARLMPAINVVFKELMDEDRADIERKINAVKPNTKKKPVK